MANTEVSNLGYNLPAQPAGYGKPVPAPYPMQWGGGYGFPGGGYGFPGGGYGFPGGGYGFPGAGYGFGYGGTPSGYGTLTGVFGSIGGVPPTYPGPPGLQADPAYQYGPSFDGQYAHGLTQNPSLNSLFEDTNAMNQQINMAAGVGFPPMIA